MLIAALFIIAEKWTQAKYPPTSDWINKMWHIYLIEYNSAIRMNELLMLQNGCPKTC